MARLNHERWFLKALDSDKKARRENNRSNASKPDDETEFFSLAEQGNCPLCDVSVRSSEVMRHAFLFHGISTADKFEQELMLRKDLSKLFAKFEEDELHEVQCKRVSNILRGFGRALDWNEEEQTHLDALAQAVEHRVAGTLDSKRMLEKQILELRSRSIDKKIPELKDAFTKKDGDSRGGYPKRKKNRKNKQRRG